MRPKLGLVVRCDGERYVVDVAPAEYLGPRPRALRSGDVDEVEVRSAGAQLDHSVLRQARFDRTAGDAFVERQRLLEIVDEEQNVIDAENLERLDGEPSYW